MAINCKGCNLPGGNLGISYEFHHVIWRVIGQTNEIFVQFSHYC